ncbi:hypothetical protein CBL_07484 [Carabus blaptoides fortunei]
MMPSTRIKISRYANNDLKEENETSYFRCRQVQAGNAVFRFRLFLSSPLRHRNGCNGGKSTAIILRGNAHCTQWRCSFLDGVSRGCLIASKEVAIGRHGTQSSNDRQRESPSGIEARLQAVISECEVTETGSVGRQQQCRDSVTTIVFRSKYEYTWDRPKPMDSLISRAWSKEAVLTDDHHSISSINVTPQAPQPEAIKERFRLQVNIRPPQLRYMRCSIAMDWMHVGCIDAHVP